MSFLTLGEFGSFGSDGTSRFAEMEMCWPIGRPRIEVGDGRANLYLSNRQHKYRMKQFGRYTYMAVFDEIMVLFVSGKSWRTSVLSTGLEEAV